jgi:hypothetical protein
MTPPAVAEHIIAIKLVSLLAEEESATTLDASDRRGCRRRTRENPFRASRGKKGADSGSRVK